jgi:RNA polymerase sigma-70 factor (ECF subfamily)
MDRYGRAAYRYLLGAVRNPDTADDLFQDFALRFVRGGFERASPQRGRFRDYLKTSLYHLVADHYGRQQKRAAPLDPAVAEAVGQTWAASESDQQFVSSWRAELLSRTWKSLEEDELAGGQPSYTVLRFRTEHPTATSAEMARQLSEQLKRQPPFSETSVRKTLQRARARFADTLLRDVAFSLGNPSAEELEQELIDLELLAYCRSALARRKSNR